MYRHKFIPKTPASRVNVEHVETFKPLSHYVLGGCDITGEHTALTNPTVYDAKEVEDFSAPNALTSPRVGFFELAEMTTGKKAKNMADSAKAGEKPQ